MDLSTGEKKKQSHFQDVQKSEDQRRRCKYTKEKVAAYKRGRKFPKRYSTMYKGKSGKAQKRKWKNN